MTPVTGREMLTSPERYLVAELLRKGIEPSLSNPQLTLLASLLPESEVQSLVTEYSSLLKSLAGSDDTHPALYWHLIMTVQACGLQPSALLLSEDSRCACTTTEWSACTTIREYRTLLRRIQESSRTLSFATDLSMLSARYAGGHDGLHDQGQAGGQDH